MSRGSRHSCTPTPITRAIRGVSGARGSFSPTAGFLSAIGDHLGADGNSYLYEYDPETSELALVSDVLSLVEHESGRVGVREGPWSNSLPGRAGEAYVGTYWGTREDLEYEGSYRGDVLIRWDPNPHEFTVLGVSGTGARRFPRWPGWGEGGPLYGESVDPEFDADYDSGTFFVYDVTEEAVVFETDTPHVGYRNIMVDAAGHAYFAAGDGELWRYDPATWGRGTPPGDLARMVAAGLHGSRRQWRCVRSDTGTRCVVRPPALGGGQAPRRGERVRGFDGIGHSPKPGALHTRCTRRRLGAGHSDHKR